MPSVDRAGFVPADWTIATPTAAAYTAKTSVTTLKVADLEPADKAWPMSAVFKGLLYLARSLFGRAPWLALVGATLTSIGAVYFIVGAVGF